MFSQALVPHMTVANLATAVIERVLVKSYDLTHVRIEREWDIIVVDLSYYLLGG